MKTPQDPNGISAPLFQKATPRRDPREVTTLVGIYVKAMLHLIYWAVLGAAGLAAGFVAVSAIWLFTQYALRAIGG